MAHIPSRHLLPDITTFTTIEPDRYNQKAK